MADKSVEEAVETVQKEEGKEGKERGERKEKGDKGGSPERNKKLKKPKERKFDWPKKNYFDVVLDARAEGGSGEKMKKLVHRLVAIGKLRDGCEDRVEVGNHYDRLLKNLQNNFATEPITGLLLVYMKHIVHMVEASSDMLTEISRDIVKEQKHPEHGFLEDSKILVVSHDVPTRLYQQWSFRTLDIQAARMESYEASEGADKIIIDILTQCMKLGHKLALTPKISLKSTLDTLHEKFPDLLPQQGHLHYLMEENDSVMMSTEEFLDLYEKPYDVVLNSEQVWPLPTRLFPYN